MPTVFLCTGTVLGAGDKAVGKTKPGADLADVTDRWGLRPSVIPVLYIQLSLLKSETWPAQNQVQTLAWTTLPAPLSRGHLFLTLRKLIL